MASCARRRTKNIGIREQRNCVLRILQQAFKANEEKCFIFPNRQTHRSTKLLASQRILNRRTERIRIGRIEGLAGLQCLGEGKRILSVHGIVAEKTIETAVKVVSAGLGHNIDGSAGGPAEVRAVVAAIDLKFLHCVLAHGQAHAAAVSRGLSTVDRYAVAATVAAVERQAAGGRLLDSKILVAGKPGGIGNPRRQQRKRKVIAPVNRQVG